MVRYLIKHGISQFLSFDAGVPTRGHIHEVAHPLLPDARVVYLDNDPLIAEIGQELLDGNEHATYLHADTRAAADVLNHPDLRRLINLANPVAIMMLDTLQYVPDRDTPATLIAPYTDAVPSHSYLALSQFSQTQHMLDGLTLFSQMYGQPPAIPFREPEQLAHLFAELNFDLVEPGIVPLPLWHPDPDQDITTNPERIRVYAGLGQKP
jgi:hypothetical protein